MCFFTSCGFKEFNVICPSCHDDYVSLKRVYNVLLQFSEECSVSVSNCRLVKYDHYHQALERSLDDEPENQDEPLAQLLGMETPTEFSTSKLQ